MDELLVGLEHLCFMVVCLMEGFDLSYGWWALHTRHDMLYIVSTSEL
jgi:hypothetical protein